MKPFIFAVNAISGGGKTAAVRELQKRLANSKALYFDDRNYDSDSGIEDTVEWVEAGADVNLWDLTRLAGDIDNLIKESPEFIIMDYPFGYKHNLIAPYLDYSVFIDTPLDIALARRVIRDYDAETIVSIFDDMRFYFERGRNADLFGLDFGKENADFIVCGSLKLDEIAELICDKVMAVKKLNCI